MFTTYKIQDPSRYARMDWIPGSVAFWCIANDEPAAWLILDADGIVRRGSFQGYARVAFGPADFRATEYTDSNQCFRMGYVFTGPLAD